MLPVRSFKQGQITSDEVRDLLARMRDAGEHKTGEVLEGMAAIGSYAGDILVADAGLHVAGHLDLSRERAWVLMVCGNLVVDGVFSDYLYGDDDDPGSHLLVTGDMRARGVITAGWMEVHGSLACGHLIGDYNDCSAYIGGDVHAGLFYGEEHFFTIKGALHAGLVISGPTGPRLDVPVEPEVISTADPRLLDYLDRELLYAHDVTYEDGSPVLGIDLGELCQRVRNGTPLRTA